MGTSEDVAGPSHSHSHSHGHANEDNYSHSHEKEIRKYLLLLQDALAIKFTQEFGESNEEKGLQVPYEDGDSSQNQSVKGSSLFKEFLEANLPCIWNLELHSAISSLKYKGMLVPSTVLVGAVDPEDQVSIPQIKTAWARKVLKSPKGYRIEFIGEIDELLADPVEPSNFIPLSDSICWAIHELTSTGQEAFVDVILSELAASFPEVVMPPRALLYEILERLTKANKVYQTQHGYFITGGKEVVMKGQGISKNEVDMDTMKRASSLRNSIRKPERVAGCLPRRTFSLRSKKNRKAKSGSTSDDASEVDLNLSKESLVVERRRKHKSFLKTWLTFKKTKSPSDSPTKCHLQLVESPTTNSKEMSTQTSNSLENLQQNFGLLSLSPSSSCGTPSSSTITTTPSPTLPGKERDARDGSWVQSSSRDSDSGRFTESSACASSTKEGGRSPSDSLPPPPTPTPSVSTTSSSYLFNNPYRRRYLSYLSPSRTFSETLSSVPSSRHSLSSLPKYPPRPFEKRQIYEKLKPPVLQHAKIVTKPRPEMSRVFQKEYDEGYSITPFKMNQESSSDVQVEVLLPLGKLISNLSEALNELDDKKKKSPQDKGEEGEREESKGQNIFSVKSSLHTNAKTSSSFMKSEVDVDVGVDLQFKRANNRPTLLQKCGVEKVSFKPTLIQGCRESEII